MKKGQYKVNYADGNSEVVFAFGIKEALIMACHKRLTEAKTMFINNIVDEHGTKFQPIIEFKLDQ